MADNMNLTTEYEKREDVPTRARKIVHSIIKHPKLKEDPEFSLEDVYVVWFAFTLGNWKALVSTTSPDGRYYEVTHNREKAEIYVDTYEKIDNLAFATITHKKD